MRLTIILTIFTLSYLQTSAQKNNFEIGLGSHHFHKVNTQPEQLNLQLKLRYSRKFKQNLKLYFEYDRLTLNATYTLYLTGAPLIENIGKIERIENLNYFDIGGIYNLYTHKKHQVNFNFGVSTALAKNAYLTHTVWLPKTPREPNGHFIYKVYSDKLDAYFGGLAGFKYDYTIWNNRINIGANFSARYYFEKKNAKLENPYPNTIVPDPNIPNGRHSFPFQINYGIHVGYNF